MSKARRVDYGSGSVYQIHDHATCPPSIDGTRPDHTCQGRWVGIIEAGWTASGTRRRIKISAKTEAQARRRLRQRRAKIEAEGMPTAAGADRMRIKVYAERWLPIAKTRLRPNAYTADASAVSRWIIPTIGHKRIADLTPGDIRAVAGAIYKAGRTGSTANRVHGTLRKMLKDALVEGYPVPQRILAMPAPPRSVNTRDAIPIPQALAILKQALEAPDASRWVAALLQGMRPAECLGLTWTMVDLGRDLLDVSWQLQPLPYDHGCNGRCKSKAARACPDRHFRVPREYEYQHLSGQLALVRPKTARGQRIIPVVPWMHTALEQWRQAAPPSPHNLVWPSDDGNPRDEKDDRAAWKALQVAAGVTKAPAPPPTEDDPHPEPIRWDLYEARHTTATLLLESGIDSEIVKAIMGHTKIATTRNYQHVNAPMIRDAMSIIAGRLGLTAST